MELTATDVRGWLAEDVGAGDATTNAVIDEGATCDARVLLKEPGVVCGLDVAAAVFEELGATLEPLAADGDRVEQGAIARVSGPARAVLTGERLALNLLGRLCGIATLTRRYVDAVDGTGASSSTLVRRRRGCASSRSRPSAAEAARTIASASTTGS